MLIVPQFLREHSLQRLSENYFISCKRHKQFPQLIQFKYSQIDSPMREPLVQQCRGLILDESDDWRVVARPFDKFFNYGEGPAPTLDWRQTRFFAKLDGGLMTLYFYAGEWRVASSSLPDATGEIAGAHITRAELFWQTWHAHGYQLPQDTEHCYMFELTTPKSPVVVRYAADALALIGVRHLPSGAEGDPIETAARLGWQAAPQLPLNGLAEALAYCRELNPIAHEGLVACDADFRRVKLKSPQWVALNLIHGASSTHTQRYLLEIVRINEGDEFLAYFPQLADVYFALRDAYRELIAAVEADWEQLKGIEDRQAFGRATSGSRSAHALFALRDGKAASIRAYFEMIKIELLHKLVKGKT